METTKEGNQLKAEGKARDALAAKVIVASDAITGFVATPEEAERRKGLTQAERDAENAAGYVGFPVGPQTLPGETPEQRARREKRARADKGESLPGEVPGEAERRLQVEILAKAHLDFKAATEAIANRDTEPAVYVPPTTVGAVHVSKK